MRKNVLLYIGMIIAGTLVLAACVFLMASSIVSIESTGDSNIINFISSLWTRLTVLFTGTASG